MAYDEALAQDHARPFDLTGRPMKGWVHVAESGFEDDDEQAEWADRGVRFALSLPPK